MPKNRLLIQWDSDVLKFIGQKPFVERESFKCNSIEAAQKILDRRTGTKMKFAKWYDENGTETVMQLPKKKILKQQTA